MVVSLSMYRILDYSCHCNRNAQSVSMNRIRNCFHWHEFFFLSVAWLEGVLGRRFHCTCSLSDRRMIGLSLLQRNREKVRPPKTTVRWRRKKQAFEDVSLNKNGDFSLSCFRGSRIDVAPSTKAVTAGPLFSDCVGPCWPFVGFLRFWSKACRVTSV